MKRIPVLFILCLLALPLFSQHPVCVKPDYGTIKEVIQDKSSPYYYPGLFHRFQALDTTLNTEEYRYLYYGFVFQKNYKPYDIPTQNQQVSNLLQLEDLDKKGYDKIIKLTSQSLHHFPFNIDQLKNRSFAFHMKGNDDVALKLMKQIFGLRNAIKTSGDGKKKETAYHVITVGNEYEFLRSYNLMSVSQRSENRCDYIQVEPNPYNIEGIYFNIEQPYRQLMEAVKK